MRLATRGYFREDRNGFLRRGAWCFPTTACSSCVWCFCCSACSCPTAISCVFQTKLVTRNHSLLWTAHLKFIPSSWKCNRSNEERANGLVISENSSSTCPARNQRAARHFPEDLCITITRNKSSSLEPTIKVLSTSTDFGTESLVSVS